MNHKLVIISGRKLIKLKLFECNIQLKSASHLDCAK